MDEVKRSFLRACINRGVLIKEEAVKMLESICTKYEISEPEIAQLVKDINKEITQFDQVLTIQKYPLNRQEYIIFGNTLGLPNNLIHPTLSEEERRYFAILLDALSNANKYGLEWHAAYGLQNDTGTRQVSMKRKQELVEQWMEQGYLYDQSDFIFLGPRILVEFDYHFRTNYPDQIKECPLCKKLTFWDIDCSKCHVKIHRDCIRAFLRTRSNCPKCNSPWETLLNKTT